MKVLNTQGFIAYLSVAFLNAFIDLGHKIIIQNMVFKLYDGQQQIMLTAIVNALILLPFILLFTPAGFISDRFAKHRVIQLTAAMAIAATAVICFAYYQGWFWLAFALTLFLAVQSAIYSPAKYGYIRELVGNEKLTTANGFVQAVTIVSILFATFFFSIIFESLFDQQLLQNAADPASSLLQQIAVIGWILIALAVLEFLISLKLKSTRAGDSSKQLLLSRYLKGEYFKQNIQLIRERRTIMLSIIGLCLFWSISQIVLAAFPAYAKEVLHENNTVVIQGILACTGFGIMLGSLFAGLMSRQHIELGFIPLGALGIVIGLFSIGLANNLAILIGIFLLLGFSGGLFIVPLNALIQYHARSHQLGMVLAGNNWCQNIAMLIGLSLTVALAWAGANSGEFFIILAVVALIGSLYTVKQLPHSLARILVSVVIKRRYRLHIQGFEHLPKQGASLLLGNHVSWIDWLFIQLASPRPIHFVIFNEYYDKAFFKPILRFFGAIPIGSGQTKQAINAIADRLNQRAVVCLFPEGQLTTDGQMNDFKSGYQLALRRSSAPVKIIPFYLDGLWGSRWSKATGDAKGSGQLLWFKRHITIRFGPALTENINPDELALTVKQLAQGTYDD